MELLPSQPELLFHSGLIICAIAITYAVLAAIVLCISKSRLNKKLDSEFGKRSTRRG
jgi:uncharacterized membrane protein